MKAKYFASLLYFFIIYSFNGCKPDPCNFNYVFENASSAKIEIVTLKPGIPIDPRTNDTLILESGRGISFNMGRGFSEVDYVVLLDAHDSIQVIFNDIYQSIHYRNPSLGNFNHSLFNIEVYQKDDCTNIFTFKESDFEAAKNK